MADNVDMRQGLPGARDQGARPTCLAFAASDAHMLAAHRGDLLSPEYLHFHAALRSGVKLTAGVGREKLLEALRLDGQPTEAECPYDGDRDESWTPPSGLKNVWTRGSSVHNGVPSQVLRTALLSDRAFILVLRISHSFFMPDPTSHMVSEDGGKGGPLHAVLVVGIRSDDVGAAFLVRNSWGCEWGLEGHAWLPSGYVDGRGIAVIEIEQEPAS